MARGIHNIDLHIAILYGGVLGQNGDAALPLQVVGVHHALGYGLILPECAALLEHLVHQRGLSVVDVGDNCNVTNIFSFHFHTYSRNYISFLDFITQIRQNKIILFYKVINLHYTDHSLNSSLSSFRYKNIVKAPESQNSGAFTIF